MSSRGDEFMEKAEKRLKAFSLFNKSGKFTDAADLYTKGGNSYRSVREWVKAGEAYLKAADCWLHVNQINDAAVSYADAAKMFAKDKSTIQRAIEAFNTAARMYQENSKPTNAARLLCDAAKLFQDDGNLDAAIEALKNAATLYDDENQPMQATTQLGIVADILSQQKKWLEAGAAFKDVGMRRLKDKLTALAAGEQFTKAILCQMAGDDVVAAERSLQEVVGANPGWERSREFSLLDQVIKAFQERDPNAFAQALAEYDQVKRLDNWMTEVLLEIRKLIEGEEDIC